MAITYDTGLGEYLNYGTASANTNAGRVTGGELRANPNHIWRPSIQGKHASGRGIWNGGGTATIEVADATLIGYGLRASMTSPGLTALYFEGGMVDTGGNIQGWTQSGCAIDSVEVSIAVGDPLTATITWLASDQADNEAPSSTSPSATHFEWFEGACTFDALTYALQSMTFTVNNNLEPISSVEAKGANTLVLPEDFKIGKETVTMSADMLVFPGTTHWNLHEDIAVTGLGAVISAVSGGHTITCTLANVAGTAVRMPFAADDGSVLFHFEGEGEPNNTTTVAFTYDA